MNCRQAERLLDTFFDGELDGRLMRDAALHVTKCQSCERELQAKEGVKTLLADTVRTDADAVDLGSLWTGIEAGIGRESTGGGATEQTDDARRPVFGKRGSGRYRGASRRGGGRRGVGRVSAASVGAVAVGLAAFLVFNVGPERENEELLATPGAGELGEASPSTGTAAVAAQDEAPAETAVARRDEGEPKAAAETAVASAAASRSPVETAVASRSPVETVALGPVGSFRPQDPPLGPEWTQQLQVGPVQYSDHAMSLWRDAAAR